MGSIGSVERAGSPVEGSRWPLALLEAIVDRIPLVEKEMLLVRRLLEPGWVCLDIGAAGGTYTHLLARGVGQGGEVHAVEPRSGAMRNLRRLRRWLGWTNVRLHQVALSDRSGQAELIVPRWVRTEAHLAPSPDGDRPRAATVRTLTLDQLVEGESLDRLDVILCDVEGAELRILAGAERTIDRFRPVVVCEIEARHLRRYGVTPEAVLRWFDARRYLPYRVHARRLVPVDGVSARHNDYVLWPVERPLDGAG